MSVRIIVSLLAVLAIGAGAGVVIGGDGDDGRTTAVTGTTTATAPEDDPFKPGARFSEPPAVRSRNGKLSATLVAENGIVKVNGPDGFAVAGTQTYAVEGVGERGILGPTLHVKPGERVELTLDNRLTVPQDAPPKTPNCAETGEHEPGHAATGEPGDSQFTNVHFHGLH